LKKKLNSMAKTLLFYAAVKDVSLFKTQMFYQNTREILVKLGFCVIMTNKMSDALKLKYDGFFCFFFRQGVIPALYAKIRGKKIFFTGGLDSLEKSLVKPKDYYVQVILFKLCRLLADWCLIESKSDLRNIQKISLVKKHSNLYYSPQAVDVKQYNCRLEDKEKLFSTICWQGTTGNCKRKGVDQALYYFKMLKEREEFEDYRFLIMGRAGDGTPFLQSLISELGLEDSVVLTGEVTEEEKRDFLKKSKYFFQLSLYEGFGLAALEAVASKCIPIHTGRGGLNDTLADDGVKVDYNRFDGSLGSIDTSVADKLLAISSEDIEKSYNRILSSFDSSVRLENFRKTIGDTMK